jgi:predicted dehydrogenase
VSAAGTTRWGVLATGGIAATVSRDLALVEGAELTAVASRDLGRAQAFAAEHGFATAYGSYEELLADPDVDVVYVATPHAQHHAVTSAALAAGKPALVEKAFTCSLAAADDLVRQAREAGLFVMEAMWTRFQPGVVRLRELVADGVIGEIRSVTADLGFVQPFDPKHRLYDPAQGGGALLDLGVYPVSFAQMLLGTPTRLQATATINELGTDSEAAILLDHPSGAFAQLSCTLLGDSPGRATIVGTQGRITVEPRFHHPHRIVVERQGEEAQVLDNPITGRGYAHQMEHVAACLRDGLTESPVMPLDDTLTVMAVLDEALEAVGAPHVDEGFARP